MLHISVVLPSSPKRFQINRTEFHVNNEVGIWRNSIAVCSPVRGIRNATFNVQMVTRTAEEESVLHSFEVLNLNCCPFEQCESDEGLTTFANYVSYTRYRLCLQNCSFIIDFFIGKRFSVFSSSAEGKALDAASEFIKTHTHFIIQASV